MVLKFFLPNFFFIQFFFAQHISKARLLKFVGGSSALITTDTEGVQQLGGGSCNYIIVPHKAHRHLKSTGALEEMIPKHEVVPFGVMLMLPLGYFNAEFHWGARKNNPKKHTSILSSQKTGCAGIEAVLLSVLAL